MTALSTKNGFLSLLCATLRHDRPMIPEGFDFATRVESVDNLTFINVWFRTRGCTHDHQGACTFCNYGSSTPVSTPMMIGYVREGLKSVPIDENTILLLTPSGSMFDDREVPDEAFNEILNLVHDTQCRSFLCETRAETIVEQKIRQYAQVLENKIASVEVGLESSNPWVLRYCINKQLSLGDYQQAIQLLNRYRLGSSTTIMLGAAFLSPREAIEDTLATVRWAIEAGTDRVCIFPAHVKKWTLLEWLWNHGLYEPPSLWSLVEVLYRLGPELNPRVYTAWYKVYNQKSNEMDLDPVKDLQYLSSPTTCPTCQSAVIDLLDEYRDLHDFGTIQALWDMDCQCKRMWKETVARPEATPLKARLAQTYNRMGCELLGDWWSRNRDYVLSEILASSDGF